MTDHVAQLRDVPVAARRAGGRRDLVERSPRVAQRRRGIRVDARRLLVVAHHCPSGPPIADLRDSAVRKLLAAAEPSRIARPAGRYDIERVIGAGGMGIVLKAHDSELNRPVAVKVLASHLAHVGAARERFAREGRAAAAVVHEHVVAIYNVESDGEVPFLVMQYVPGRSLQARVDADGPLAVEEILRIGMQAASGLAAAHAQGLVHRDVKPSNILLEETVERAVLTDFGLARTIDDASLTHTGVLAGTPHYMSPEQATGDAIDHRSDLFSLGAVLYFMATGHPPFRADGALAVLHRICREEHRPVWQTNKDIPDELSDLIDRLLEKKPSRRPAPRRTFRRQLARMLSRFQQFGPDRGDLRRCGVVAIGDGCSAGLRPSACFAAAIRSIIGSSWNARARQRRTNRRRDGRATNFKTRSSTNLKSTANFDTSSSGPAGSRAVGRAPGFLAPAIQRGGGKSKRSSAN